MGWATEGINRLLVGKAVRTVCCCHLFILFVLISTLPCHGSANTYYQIQLQSHCPSGGDHIKDGLDLRPGTGDE